jgi:general L-amino acid transport system permease protein
MTATVLPPATASWLQRLRETLFPDLTSSVVSALLIGGLFWALIKFILWGGWNATWIADTDACRAVTGACWGVVVEKHRLVLLGRFPIDEQWRPTIAMFALLLSVGLACLPRFFNWTGLALIGGGLLSFFVLMAGGVLGLSSVGTDLWGGLPLTLFLTVVACVVAMPMAILLALGRRSSMLVVKGLSTGFIELVRGVPLITFLFFGAFVLPLVLPATWRTDPMLRIAICLILFRAAYLAEVFRGGLQSVTKGQYEAAHALGLNKYQTITRVVLPQALRVTIAPATSSFLGALKDTSLVAVVNIYDMTGALKLAMGDAKWKPFFVEMYVVVAGIYLILGLCIAGFGRYLERRYQL